MSELTERISLKRESNQRKCFSETIVMLLNGLYTRLFEAWQAYKSLPSTTRVPNQSQSATLGKDPCSSERDRFFEGIYIGEEDGMDEDELAEYLKEKVSKPSEDILVYWNLNKGRWPQLAAMARDVLAVTATSASSERSFSVAKDLLGLARYLLLPEIMEESSCLRSWIRSELACCSLPELT